MKVKYKYDTKLNLVNVYPEGELSTLDIGNHFKDVCTNKLIKDGLIEIVYLEKITNFLFSSNEALMIQKFYKDFKSIKKIKATILIGNDDLHYGIARMVQNLFEVNDLKKDIFVVRNMDEAKIQFKKIDKKNNI